jgi:hypothetical protein
LLQLIVAFSTAEVGGFSTIFSDEFIRVSSCHSPLQGMLLSKADSLVFKIQATVRKSAHGRL